LIAKLLLLLLLLLSELHFRFCHGCNAAPAKAAMPLLLQLKSWKGCIAKLMAQPKFSISPSRTVNFQVNP